MHILGDRFAAEEVLLDVYTQVWCQASSYEQQRGTPLSWLMTMARTRAIDRMRSGKQYQQRKEPLDLAVHQKSGEVGPEEAAAISERRTLVRSALETLSPPQREVIVLQARGFLLGDRVAFGELREELLLAFLLVFARLLRVQAPQRRVQARRSRARE